MLTSLTWSQVCVYFCLCQYSFSSFLLQTAEWTFCNCSHLSGMFGVTVYQVSVLPGGLEVCS